jgi:phage/plasmid-like protein (TIGR03299 family)
MPAGILEHDQMMYNGQNGLPWHGMGTRVEGLATAVQCIEAAKLGWTVEKRKLYVDGNEADTVVQFPGQYATVRKDTGEPLGIVGEQYTVVQNVEAFEFFDAIVGKGVAMYETAGSLLNGRKVWIMAKVPGLIKVLGDDVAEKFILLAKGHDGQTEIVVGFTAVRVVCMNTLTMAVGENALRGGSVGGSFMTIRHTPGAKERLVETGRLIKACSEHYEAAAVKLQGFAKAKMGDADARRFFARVYNRELNEAGKEFKEWRGFDTLMSLRQSGRGQDLPGVRGTVWAAYNAVTEHEDHTRKLHASTDRLNRTWFGPGARTKLDAFALADRYVADGPDVLKSADELAAAN